jgi:hypothetical protein
MERLLLLGVAGRERVVCITHGVAVPDLAVGPVNPDLSAAGVADYRVGPLPASPWVRVCADARLAPGAFTSQPEPVLLGTTCRLLLLLIETP